MFDLLPESRVDEFRDILSEIDAGELDEQYLIKHARDYGKQDASHPLNTLRANIARLLNSTRRFSRPQPIDQSVKAVSRSATQ